MHDIQFVDLGLDPVALSLGMIKLCWYSLAYIAGIVAGWWYLLSLLARPAAPMIRAQTGKVVFDASPGVIPAVGSNTRSFTVLK